VSVDRAFVAHGGNGFAISVVLPDGSLQTFYVDRSGGCARPITGPLRNTGASCGVTQPVAGARTLAVLVGCGMEGFSSPTTLDTNGAVAFAFGPDIYSRFIEEIAVASDGAIFVAKGPRGLDSFRPRGGLGEPQFADTLTEFWTIGGDAAVSTVTRTDQSSILVAVDTVDTASLHGVALVLRDVVDGGFGESRVELQDHGFSFMARWTAPPDVALTGIAARGDGIALMGTTTVAGQQRAWFGVLDASDLTPRWAGVADAALGLPFGVALSQGGRLVAGTIDDAQIVRVLAYDASGTPPSIVPTYLPSDAASFTPYPLSIGIAPDGTLLFASGDRVASGPAIP
jgi:hypothetical protein